MSLESAGIVALHLGALHPYEKILTLLLAFGPFVVLGLLVVVRRRHDLAEERVSGQPDTALDAPADRLSD
ncbi:hypothetical protein [Nocardioides sp.]|uniref:hypothetical protein n=1 Tax=Nocardioides sp. TaxID=35761 RepID=UPI0039E5CB34